jgi:hypothetical protein
VSVQVQHLPLNVLADGSLERDVRLGACRLLAVELDKGDLAENYRLTLTDEPASVSLAEIENGDGRYQIEFGVVDITGNDIVGAYASPVVTGRVHVVVTGGGDKKTGDLVLIYER